MCVCVHVCRCVCVCAWSVGTFIRLEVLGNISKVMVGQVL